MSTSYYDQNAEAFFAQTVHADMSLARSRFLAHLPAGGSLLDAGCGSGRDAKAFHELGFAVEAFDASAEMVRLARTYTGLHVYQMSFETMRWQTRYDGIWACASLVHVSLADLAGIAIRFRRALKRGGVFYVSFKRGEGERQKDNRHFTDMTETRLRQHLICPGLELIESWISEDVRPSRTAEQWLNAILRHTR